MIRSVAAVACLVAIVSGCTRPLYAPERATMPYPSQLHAPPRILDDGTEERRPVVEDIHAFRDDTQLAVVNSTPRSFTGVRVWINQRWMLGGVDLPAGRVTTLSLWDFYDQWGQGIKAGGFWRTYEPTAVRLVEVQIDDASPLIGLIAINEEDPEARGQ